MIGTSLASLRVRVARLEASGPPGASIAETLRAARAKGPTPSTHTKAELEAIVAAELPSSFVARLAGARLRVRSYIAEEGAVDGESRTGSLARRPRRTLHLLAEKRSKGLSP